LDKNETRKRVEELGWWYQHFNFPNGASTITDKNRGYDVDKRWKIIEPYVPKDLQGKTCLDLGGNAGYYSIQMMLRGAKKCVLVDPYVEFLEQAKFASEQFNVELELINDDAHTYCLSTEERFDYVIFMGLLYHLKYPGLVMDRLAEMTKERMFLQSYVLGPESKNFVQKPKIMDGDDELLDSDYPKFTFIENLFNNDPTDWWLPNHEGLAAIVRSSGMKIIARPHSHVIIADPEYYFGKVVMKKCVFPRYGKKGMTIYPGPQAYDSKTLNEYLEKENAENQSKNEQ